MSQNEKRLGQGISALLGSQEQTSPAASSENPFLWLSSDQLIPNPNQPRQFFDEASLQELAESIRSQGILQPLLVRPAEESGKWQIIAGERRWKAAQIAGLEKIPVIVTHLNDSDTMIAAMMENIHRAELNPIERAKGLEAIKNALSINQVELANFLGMQRSTVTNLLRLLNLPDAAKKDVASGRLSPGQARCLITLPAEAAEELRNRIHEYGMTSRGAEIAASYWQQEHRFPWNKSETAVQREAERKNDEISNLAKRIGDTLNCRAQIRGSSERGRINLAYDSNSQLFDLLDKLGLSLEDN